MQTIAPTNNIIAQSFLKNVETWPNNNALFIDDHYYTYAELWKIVFAIYNQIPKDKVYKQIGVYCTNDITTYASILAINLYGAAYVPLNDKFPTARNLNYVEQCNIECVLASQESNKTKALADKVNFIYTDQLKSNENNQLPLPNAITYRNNEQTTAYILFTSGTTGTPKGVPVSHNNVAHFFNYLLNRFNFDQNDRFLQVFELTFDVSVFSFFMPMLVGACCYIVPNDGIKYLKIADYLGRHKITAVSLVPTTLRYLSPYFSEINFPHLRFNMFLGDALFTNLATAWQKCVPNAEIHNMYGPTEATVACTTYDFSSQKTPQEESNGIVSIGKPFTGIDILIVDEKNSPRSKGELCVAGAQVVSNYLHNTNRDRFFVYENKTYYKTGDIVCKNDNENLLFYGRVDNQVKISGYRVELAEIENVIRAESNSTCIVVFENDKLFAFIETDKLDTQLVINKIKTTLPEYMIPHKIILIDKFELNTNGKIDRSKLKTQ